MNVSLQTFGVECEVEFVRGVRFAFVLVREAAVDRRAFTVETVAHLEASGRRCEEEDECETNLKIGQWIGFFQCFDGELKEACRALNVGVVRGVLLMNQRDLSLDLFVNVGQQFLLLIFECIDKIIDVFDQRFFKSFTIFLERKKPRSIRLPRIESALRLDYHRHRHHHHHHRDDCIKRNMMMLLRCFSFLSLHVFTSGMHIS